MSRFEKATLLVHQAIGNGYYRLVLKAPAAAAVARPGQFVMLRVSETQDPFLPRPLGIASVLSKTRIELFYRVAGRGTLMLTALEPGRTLDMLGPLGSGFPLPAKDARVLLVTGGSGFPPIHFLACRIGGARRRAVLLIGTRDKSAMPPAGVLWNFRQQCATVLHATDDGSTGRKGPVTELLAEHLSGIEGTGRVVIYACGPKPMLRSVSRLAAERSIRCYVSLEERMACGLGACMGCSVPVKAGGYQRVCKEGPVFDSREIDWGEQLPVKLQNAECGARNAE